jgi:hypothetical protein
MPPITSVTLRVLALSVALVGFATGTTLRADDKPNPDLAKKELDRITKAIQQNGKLPGGQRYWQSSELLNQAKSKKIAATHLLTKKASTSQLTTVGGQGLPTGFGKGFTWDRKDDEVLLVVFVNAADPLGISIDGLHANDTIEILSASGLASFTKDKGNPLASSIVGLVSAGAKVAATAAGLGELDPVIDAAQKFAQDQFKATNNPEKIRNAFGIEPSSGLKAREEGGLLVCLPSAGGPYYSGDGDHKSRWIQSDGTRNVDKNLPAVMKGNAFFPAQGSNNARSCPIAGQAYILAWDWNFADNAGFYKVFVKLKKGKDQPPVLEVKPAKKK